MVKPKTPRKTGGKLLCLAVSALFLAAVVLAVRPRTAQSLLPDRPIAGVLFLYNSIGDMTSGPAPQIEASQPEMEEVDRFLQDLTIRWAGFYGDGSLLDVPGYRLIFFDERGMPQTGLYITSTGYLYHSHTVYRILSPSTTMSWTQLHSLYALASAP